MSLSAHQIVGRTIHPRALLSGSLGIFASFLSMGWALFGYNLPSAVSVISTQSRDLMLVQVGVAFITFVGSGLMLARYTAAGGIVNILGSLGTFVVGVYYSTGLADAAQNHDLQSLKFQFSSFFSNAYTGTISIPVDRVVSTLLLVPILPVSLLLLVSGLGALATYRSTRRLASG